MANLQDSKRANTLRDELNKHNHLYFVLDSPEILDRRVNALVVLDGLADTHAERDLVQPGNLVDVLVRELLNEFRNELGIVFFLYTTFHLRAFTRAAAQGRTSFVFLE